MSIKTIRRETFDEWWIGRNKIQFFELMLWRWGWPRALVTPQAISVALPTMSVTYLRRKETV